MKPATPQGVNPHYLDNVVAATQHHEVEASEDIVSGTGIKLLAKGARIEGHVRDRLLQHKLSKPLESSMQVTDGITPADCEQVAQTLLDKHPLLRALCASGRARPVPASLGGLTLTGPVQSLLTVYAEREPGRLEHTVGVAMLALSLGRRLLPGNIDLHRVLATAGLLHDVGELYIDPVYLAKGKRLEAEEWRHIVTHPVIGHHVLHDLEGAGPAIANLVLLHHERLDGFGYPRRIAGEAFTPDGQVLAAAEWLMALAESGLSPMMRAGMATRLVPGEFSNALLEAVSAAAREAPDAPVALDTATPLEEAVPRVVRLAGTLRRYRESAAWTEQRMAEATPELRSVLEAGQLRMRRIQSTFSSAGLDAHSPELLLGELAALNDPLVYSEVMTLVGEMEWRLRELEREHRVRAETLTVPERAVIDAVIDRLKGARPPKA